MTQTVASIEQPKKIEPWVDPLVVLDRAMNENHSIRNLLADRAAFLVCGGPSTRQLDLGKLKQRGIWSMAVNNMAGHFWSNAFVCSDPPSKFHNGIWLDPTVMKFVPIPKMRGYRSELREKVGDTFQKLKKDDKVIRITDCPNVWAFERRSWLCPDDTFFTEKSAAWGNHASGVSRTGHEKTVNTTFLAIRIMRYLGARRIFLVGVDFGMSPLVGVTDNYAFPENRDQGAVQSNNAQYRISGEWLRMMQENGTFSKFGLEIFNCNEFSELRAFPHVPFDDAIADCLKDFPKQPWSLTDWYKK